jgi:hypothetical protein
MAAKGMRASKGPGAPTLGPFSLLGGTGPPTSFSGTMLCRHRDHLTGLVEALQDRPLAVDRALVRPTDERAPAARNGA